MPLKHRRILDLNEESFGILNVASYSVIAFSAVNGPAPTQVEYAFRTPTAWESGAPGIPAPIGP